MLWSLLVLLIHSYSASGAQVPFTQGQRAARWSLSSGIPLTHIPEDSQPLCILLYHISLGTLWWVLVHTQQIPVKRLFIECFHFGRFSQNAEIIGKSLPTSQKFVGCKLLRRISYADCTLKFLPESFWKMFPNCSLWKLGPVCLHSASLHQQFAC